MKQYDAYLFDLYGTLVDIHTDENKPAPWQALGAFCPGWEPGALRAAFLRLAQEQQAALRPLFVCPEIDLRPVFAQLLGTGDEERIAGAAWAFRRASTSHLRLYAGALELLDALRQRGRRVILLSNAQRLFTLPELKLLGLENRFDRIVLSSDHGCKKPDPAFFRLPLEEFDLDPARCLMIGNDPVCDILGANAVGLDSFYIHSALSPAYDPQAPATYRQLGMDLRRARRLIEK